MIGSIDINNFRCFRKTKISGFGHINLLGGKNNAGKTALLESIYLASSPKAASILKLQGYRRGLNLDTIKQNPTRAWNTLFHNYEIDLPIEIISHDNNKSLISKVFLKQDSSTEEFMTLLQDLDDNQDEVHAFLEHLTNRDYEKSTLQIFCETENYIPEQHISFITASSQGILNKGINVPDIKNVVFIPSSDRLSSTELAKGFDRLNIEENTATILEIIQIIDPSISNISSFNLGSQELYLKRKSHTWMPIHFFGDAISRITDITIRLLNNKGSILLLDEIENGTHYSIQKDLLRIFFQLAIDLNIQIFATTHSLELIQAFSEVGQEFHDKTTSAYIELTHNIRTKEIVSIIRNMDTLTYKLRIDKGKGVRGE